MIEKKKVWILVDQLNTGGVQKACIFQAKELQKLGVTVELVIIVRIREMPYLKELCEGLDVRFLIDEIPKLKAIFLLPSLKFPFFSFFAPFHLLAPFFCSNLFSDDEIDIVISHGTYTCFLAKRATKNKKIRYVPFIHDPAAFILKKVYEDKFLGKLHFVLDPLARWLDQFLLNGSSFVLTQSYVHKPYLSAIRSQPEVKVINSGVETVKSAPRSTSPYNLISATKWDFGKNPELLVEIMSHLKGSKYNLTIVGNWMDANHRKKIEKSIKELDLEPQIKITGYVTEDELIELYSQSSILIHTIQEAFGLTCLEAAAQGCPFVIPTGSGVTELFDVGESCYEVEQDDVSAYLACLDNFTTYKSKTMPLLALKQARQNTWAAQGKQLLKAIYDQG